MPWSSDPWRLQGEAQYVQGNYPAARANFRKAIDKDPNNWLLWADLATVGTHGTWRAPARRALALNPLAPELAEFRKAWGQGLDRAASRPTCESQAADPADLSLRVVPRRRRSRGRRHYERGVRARSCAIDESYDSSRGDPAAWLIGIAQRCIAGASRPLVLDPEGAEKPAPGRMDEEVQQRLTLKAALATLGDRDQELLALRYGADLTARQIADVLELKVNAVEVGLHRALARLRENLESEGIGAAAELLASL